MRRDAQCRQLEKLERENDWLREQLADQNREEAGRLAKSSKRIKELEDALVTIKRWVDSKQFDGEACRQWVIIHVGEAKAR